MSLWGEPFKGGEGQWQEGKDGENILPAPVWNRQGGGMYSQEPERGWGSRGFVSSVGLEPMLNGIPPSAPSCLPPCCIESASLGYANLGVI